MFVVVVVVSLQNIRFVLDPVIDTCNSNPSDHFVTLPDGCVKHGTTENKVNIGKCDNHPCLRADTPFKQSCEEEERCCQPGAVSDTIVRCGHGEFTVEKVLSCSCDVCTEGNTVVKGIEGRFQHFMLQSVKYFRSAVFVL